MEITVQHRLSKIWVFGAFLALLVVSGCFRVRPVEPPGSSNSDWVSPTDYQILIENLSNSIAQRNTQNYLRCFNPERLEFLPAATLRNDNASIWLNWSLLDEQTWFDNMVADLAIINGNSLSLVEVDLQDVAADSLRYVGEYQLRVNHPDSTLTTLFKGQLQFVMRLNEFNEWAISRWEDVETRPDSSWSLLKLRYVQ